MVVDGALRQLVQQKLGSNSKKILVTGGTGFVGSRLAETLVDAGHEVTISGRSHWRVRSRGNFMPADIANAETVKDLCRGKEIVFHCAALTSPWGSLESHKRVNVQGTSNVVEGCLLHDVKRLVHVSSTAILFQFRDQTEIVDDAPFPEKFCNPYAQTKAEAEEIVQDAIQRGLSSWIIRARAVFGPGDNVLLPRLIEAAEQGKLRQIGDGKNVCDLTYIDNLIAGLILAASTSNCSGLCTITNHEPVALWPLLKKVIKEVTGRPLTGKVSRKIAIKGAALVEWKHRIMKSTGEPPITRYSAGLLSHDQTFRSETAKKILGYQPIVSLQQGVQRTIEFLRSGSEKKPSVRSIQSVRFLPRVTLSFHADSHSEERHQRKRSFTRRWL
jgi:nucleoside-diphosphate-sugar epimerase